MIQTFRSQVSAIIAVVFLALSLNVVAVQNIDLTDSLVAANDNSESQVEVDALQAVDKQKNSAEEKECMMVCEQWGKDCMINPRTGQKKCRRVCKQMAQHCF